MSDCDKKTTKFLSFCEDNGILFKPALQGIRFQECPSCGSQKYKLFAYTDNSPLRGACAKCGWKFNGKILLKELGYEDSDINNIFGLDTSMEIETTHAEQKHEDTKEVPTISKPNYWLRVDDDLYLPAAKYALKRHVIEDLYDRVLIDAENDSVVFICTDVKNREIGWQMRFRSPFNPKMKTKTMPNFKCHENLFYLINKQKPLVLCEGPFTAVAAYRLGFSAACFFGSSPSIEQFNIVEYLMLNYSINKVILAFDQDDVGLKANLKAASYMEENDIDYIFGIPEVGVDVAESLDVGKGMTLSPTLKTDSLIFNKF